MDLPIFSVLSNGPIIIGGSPPGGQGGEGADVTTGIATPQNVPAGQQEQPPGMGWSWLLIWGGVILLMYFLMFRPQRKREKKLKEMQASINTGDNVITNAGLFGKVADVGEDCFVIEFGTNRGIRIPVLKSEVIGIRSPQMTPQAPKE